ncbi:MAG: DUF6427 family protein [Bacteroidales bacterium]
MLVRLFRGTTPGIVVLIVLIGLASWLGALTGKHESISSSGSVTGTMPLYYLLVDALGTNGFPGVFLSFLLVLLTGLLLVNFNTSIFFINERTFLPSLFYFLLTGFFTSTQSFNPVLPAALLLMLAFWRIVDSYRKQETAYNFFDAAFLIGTSTLFYANMIWFAILPFIGIALLRTGNIKEIFLALLGLLAPFTLVTGFYYVTGRDLMGLYETFRGNLFNSIDAHSFTKLEIASLVLLGLMTLTGLVLLFSGMGNMKIKSRKTFSLLIWSFLISIVVYAAVPGASVEIVYILILPLSYIFTYFFLFMKRKVVAEVAMWLLLAIIAIQQIMVL